MYFVNPDNGLNYSLACLVCCAKANSGIISTMCGLMCMCIVSIYDLSNVLQLT